MKIKFTPFVLAGYVLRAHHEDVDIRTIKRISEITLERYFCHRIPGITERAS